MQDLKIYILIEDPVTKNDVSIKGDFEVLRAFLLGVGDSEIPTVFKPSDPQPKDRNRRQEETIARKGIDS